jgi:hypothetical protein
MKLDILNNVHQLKIRNKENTSQVWDPIRKKWVIFTPEEMVRQLFVHFMITEKNISPGAISIEKQIKLDKKIKRCDIIVFDTQVKPILIVECKSPDLTLSEYGISQVVRYQHRLKTIYVGLVNGHDCLIFKKDQYEKWQEVEDFKFIFYRSSLI